MRSSASTSSGSSTTQIVVRSREPRQIQHGSDSVMLKQTEQKAEGSAGGGMVKVVVTGGMKIDSLHIDKEVIDPDDPEMLEDLLTAALNEVLAKVQSMQMGQLAGLAGSLGIGGIPGLQP